MLTVVGNRIAMDAKQYAAISIVCDVSGKDVNESAGTENCGATQNNKMWPTV